MLIHDVFAMRAREVQQTLGEESPEEEVHLLELPGIHSRNLRIRQNKHWGEK